MTKTTEDPKADDPGADVVAWIEAAQGQQAQSLGIWKHDEVKRKLVYLDNETLRGTPEQVLQAIRARWGGGDYQIRAYGPKTAAHPGGSYGTVEVSLAGLPKPIDGEKEPDQPETELDRERRRREELEAKVRELEEKGLEARLMSAVDEVKRMVQEMRNPPPQAADAAIVPMFVSLMKEWNAAMAPHLQTPVRETGLELLPSVFDLVKQSISLGAASGEPGGGGYARVLDRVMPSIEAIVQRIAAPPAIGAGTDGTPNPQPDGAPAAMIPTDLRSALQPLVPRLISWASNGSNPYVRADQTIEDLTPHWRGELARFLQEQGGSPLTTVLTWYPELAGYRQWLQVYIERVRSDLLEDEGEVQDAVEVSGPEIPEGS